MALFKYKAIDSQGKQKEGVIDAANMELAIVALQRRGFTIVDINSAEKKTLSEMLNLSIFERIPVKDIVVLSRQIATLFEAQISALRAFQLLAAESQNPALKKHLFKIADDIQAGSSIAEALAKHPKLFNDFYVSMVKAGEESGRLDETFLFLADYLDKTYEVTSKAKNALIYPAFIVFTFIAVMILMLVTVIPKLSAVLLESGQDVPLYTKAVIGVSSFLTKFFWLFAIIIVVAIIAVVRYAQTDAGKAALAKLKTTIPYIGTLYKYLYLSRIADSLSTTLKSGIRLVRGIEIAAAVVGDPNYEEVLKEMAKEVTAGKNLSELMRRYPDLFPGIMVAMVKIGEESGDMGHMLDTMAKFYRREVTGAVDTLVSMIEPLMIVMLAVGVGFLLASVLVPIYNISAGI